MWICVHNMWRLQHSKEYANKLCVCYVAYIAELSVNSKLHHSSPGIYPDHLRGALLWWLRDEGPSDKLWEELQPAALHVHHALHQERTAARRAQRAVQEEDHPHHHACLPLRQDSHQCHPERGGKCMVQNVWQLWRNLSPHLLLDDCNDQFVQ